jgi:glycosyltransferase involved in cell wall biosynthesis/aminoglycoside phosphotransferase (APT) family kinase protein
MNASALTNRALDAKAAPQIRSPIAIFLSRFPLITETFILREMIELERQGQPVRLIPLLRERAVVVHDEARPWIERAEYTPFLSRQIIASNLRLLRRRPLRYFSLIAHILLGCSKSANLFFGALGIFPKSVHLAERLAEEGVSHLHAHYATHPALAVKIVSDITGLPYSFTTHAHDIFVHRAMLKEKIRGASFVRVISRFNQDFLRRLDPSIPREKLPLVRVGIPADQFEPAYTPPAHPQPRILCVAALKPYKGLSVLIETCRRLKAEGWDFVCDIVGDGPLKSAIQEQIACCRLKDRVYLRGSLPQTEVAKLMATCTVFVLPSVVAADGQMEGIPVALMEAMACRRPVITSRLSGIPELVEDGMTGVLVEPADVQGLVGALKRVCGDPRLARRLGEAGRRRVVMRHSLERSVGSLLDLMDRYRSPIRSEAKERLRHLDSPGIRGTRLGLRWEQCRRDSWIAGILVSDAGQVREVVIKHHRTRENQSRAASVRARREYEILSRLQHQISGKLGVPRVLHLDQREATLVMETCDGIPLTRLLTDLRKNWDAGLAEPSLRLCGEWLNSLQRHNPAGGDPFDRIQVLMDRSLEHLSVCRRTLGLSITAEDIRREFETHSGRLSSPSLVPCGVHGDFWPGNIFVGKNQVNVIDFEGYSEGLPFEDVACLLVHLELFFSYPFSRRRVPTLAGAFLTGYLDGARADPAALHLGRMVKGLELLANMRFRESSNRMLRVWQVAYLDKALQGKGRW